MSALHPRILDALFEGLVRASCECPHKTAGHELERLRRADQTWYRLSPCEFCRCPGGRDPSTPRRRLRVVGGEA
jgi:hypothetical protein